MSQAKLRISKDQAARIGLLVPHIKPVSNIIYDPKAGVNLYETAPNEVITVPDGADLTNLKRFQTAGYFDVIEGTVLPHAAVFQSITDGNGTLTLTFSGPVTAPTLYATAEGADSDDIIYMVNGVATEATFGAVTNSTTISAPVDVTLEDVSIKITQVGASKILDASRSAVLPGTKTFAGVVPIFQDISVEGTLLKLHFNEKMYTAGVSSTDLGQESDDLIILVDDAPTQLVFDPIAKANATNVFSVDMGAEAPDVDVSVTLTAAGAAKILDTDDNEVAVPTVARIYVLNDESMITAFSVEEQVGESIIDDTEGSETVAFNMPYGTVVTAVTPVITVSENATVSPASGVAQDFRNPVTYTVTAENGTTTAYTVTCTVNPNTEADLVSMSLGYLISTRRTIIDRDTNSIDIELDSSAEAGVLETVAPIITISDEATITIGGVLFDPEDHEQRFDFSVNNPQTCVITAQDGVTTSTWSLYIHILDAQKDTEVTEFSINGQEDANLSYVDGKHNLVREIKIIMPHGTDRTGLVATFVIPAGAVASVGEVGQVSGTTQNDFTNPVTYTITSADGTTTSDWTVTVLILPS